MLSFKIVTQRRNEASLSWPKNTKVQFLKTARKTYRKGSETFRKYQKGFIPHLETEFCKVISIK